MVYIVIYVYSDIYKYNFICVNLREFVDRHRRCEPLTLPGTPPGSSGGTAGLWVGFGRVWGRSWRALGALGELWKGLGELWDVSERVNISKNSRSTAPAAVMLSESRGS